MKKWTLAALVAGQIAGAAPAQAAELVSAAQPGAHQVGAFAGARVRLPLDGARRDRARVALIAAPTLHMMRSNGERRVRFGEGFELGRQGDRLLLSYAGRPVSRIVDGATGPDGERRAISTLGWVAIGVGATVVLAYLALGVCYEAGECFEANSPLRR